jgi:hypothetical protein
MRAFEAIVTVMLEIFPPNHKEGFAYSIGTHIASMATGALRTLQRLLAAEF